MSRHKNITIGKPSCLQLTDEIVDQLRHFRLALGGTDFHSRLVYFPRLQFKGGGLLRHGERG